MFPVHAMREMNARVQGVDFKTLALGFSGSTVLFTDEKSSETTGLLQGHTRVLSQSRCKSLVVLGNLAWLALEAASYGGSATLSPQSEAKDCHLAADRGHARAA